MTTIRTSIDPKTLAPVEVAAAYCKISPATLRSWTSSGHAPHYFLGDEGPYYRKTELRDWVIANLLVARGGLPTPKRIDILCPVSETEGATPPLSISAIENLCRLMVNGHTSGIYFLCDGQDVVYVGQSVSVLGRVATHLAERIKEFLPERVFFLPCPAEDLTRIENHYIRLLRPKYNTIGNPQRKPREPKAKSAAETAAQIRYGKVKAGLAEYGL